MEDYFTGYGEIESIKVKYHTKSGNDFAFVLFKNKDEFEKMMQEKGNTTKIGDVELVLERTLLRDELKRTQMEEAEKRRKTRADKKKRKKQNKKKRRGSQNNASLLDDSQNTKEKNILKKKIIDEIKRGDKEKSAEKKKGLNQDKKKDLKKEETTPVTKIKADLNPQTDQYKPPPVKKIEKTTPANHLPPQATPPPNNYQNPPYQQHPPQNYYPPQQNYGYLPNNPQMTPPMGPPPYNQNYYPPQQYQNPNMNYMLYQYHQTHYKPPQPYYYPPNAGHQPSYPQNHQNHNFNQNIQKKESSEEKEKGKFQLESPYTRFSTEHLSDIDNETISSHQPLRGFEPTRIIADETQSEKRLLSETSKPKKRDTFSYKSDYQGKASSELEEDRLKAIMDQDYMNETASVIAQSGKGKREKTGDEEDDGFVCIDKEHDYDPYPELHNGPTTQLQDKEKSGARNEISMSPEVDEFLMGFKVVEKNKKKRFENFEDPQLDKNNSREEFSRSGRYVSKEADLFCRKDDNKVVKSTWRVWDENTNM